MRSKAPERVNAGFAIALAIVAVVGVAAITSSARFVKTSRDVGRSHELLRHIASVLFHLTDAESAQHGYLITGNDEYLQGYRETVAGVTLQIHRMRDLTFDDAEQQNRFAFLGALAARRIAFMNENIDEYRSGDREQAIELVRSGRGKEVMDSIVNLAGVIDRVENKRLATRTRDAARRGRAASVVIGAGSIFAFLAVLGSALLIRRDYTERRRAEFALRNSQTLLSQFMEHLPIGVVVVDADSRVRFANNAAVDMVGSSLLLETGDRPLPLYDIAESRPVPEAETPLARALAGYTASTDNAKISVAGRDVPIELSAAPIYDARGRITYAIASFSDATERRRAEEALRAAKEAAEAASRTKSDFLARMSHELRTPLNSVIGFAGILLKNKSGSLRQQELAYLTRILENGKHLLHLINDILDLSKIEAGKVELDVAPADVAGIVRDVVAHLEANVKRDQLELRTRLPQDMDPIVTDAVRLRQVLLNLLGNALKFTERGFVEVRVELADDGRTPTSIVVEDTGIGIPPDRLDAIFDAFEQAESSTSRKYGGTGLGLPISRALCELLGCELSVTSEVDVGTRFTVALQPRRPAGVVAADARREPVRASASSGADRLVLIVDDEDDARIVLTHYVEEFGCRAIATHTAASALALARELQPDLITLDLMMPGVNSWELLTALKEDPQLASIPVVIVSIVAQESRASLLGALDIVQKPVDRDSLFRVLDRNLASTRPRVLVVDDSADMRKVMGELLGDDVSELRMAQHGEEALTVLREFTPDIIITDLLMPVMDGLTFLEILRGTHRFQHVPVVVLTAHDLTAEDQERLRRHTTMVLQKGNAMHTDLRELLRTMLGADAAA